MGESWRIVRKTTYHRKADPAGVKTRQKKSWTITPFTVQSLNTVQNSPNSNPAQKKATTDYWKPAPWHMCPISLQNKRCSLLYPVPFNNWPQSRQAQSLCRSLGVSKSGGGKRGGGGRGALIEEYIPLFSQLEDAPPDKYSCFFFSIQASHSHIHTHT